MTPLVSICVPLYNKVAYIERTLRALLAQTYPHLEIVVLDNACTDGSTEIVHQQMIDGRIRCHRLSYTISQNESWRYCMQLARGEFVNLHRPPDTTLPPDFVEKMVAPLLADASIGFSVCDAKIVPAPGFDERATDVMVNVHRFIAEYAKDLTATPSRRERAAKLLPLSLENRVGTPYTALVRRSALPWEHWKKTASYWPESYADWDFMLRLYLIHRGVWVDDTHMDYHLDESMGYWKVVSGSDPRLMLHDKMYRLMMPITLLCDPELAELRSVGSIRAGSELVNAAMQRLYEAMTLAQTVET